MVSAVSEPPPGGALPAAALATRELSKVYGNGTVALDRVGVEVAAGEFMVVVGPTGCGKTTFLRLVAGLEPATSGHVLLDGEVIDERPTWERQVAMVSQEFTLYPHLTVAENIGFPLRVGGVPHPEERVARVADMLGLASVLHRHPAQLSGGERQRAATGRALVREPRVLLLDEPLSHLDPGARTELRIEVARLTHRMGVATVYVTHDQTEALAVADRVMVLRRGVVQQIGTPSRVYADPESVFVAAFLGMPRPNLVQAAIYVSSRGWADIDLGSQLIRVDAADPRCRQLAKHHAERVTLALRADALTPTGPDAPGPVIKGAARDMEYTGDDVLVHLDADVVGTAPQLSQLELPEPEQDLVVVVPARQRPRPGETLTFAVDLDRLLLFDRHGGRIRLD